MKCLRWNDIPASGRESSSLSIPFGKALTEVLGPSSWRDSAVSQARISSDGGGGYLHLRVKKAKGSVF